jgi:hypothetical protein
MKEPRSAPPREQVQRWNEVSPSQNEPMPSDVPDAPRASAPKRSGKTFSVLNSEAIFAELAEPDYLIENVVPRGSLIEVVAYGSSGKTWIAVDAALSVAAGVPWLGRFAAKAGVVTHFDYENGGFEMRRRIQGIARGRGLTFPVSGIELCSMPNGYMSDGAEFGTRMMAHAKGRALIIIDTLKAANPGVDENDSNMRIGLDQFRRVGEATGCAFTEASPPTLVVLLRGVRAASHNSPAGHVLERHIEGVDRSTRARFRLDDVQRLATASVWPARLLP